MFLFLLLLRRWWRWRHLDLDFDFCEWRRTGVLLHYWCRRFQREMNFRTTLKEIVAFELVHSIALVLSLDFSLMLLTWHYYLLRWRS